jgi:hypothetical protein
MMSRPAGALLGQRGAESLGRAFAAGYTTTCGMRITDHTSSSLGQIGFSGIAHFRDIDFFQKFCF